jgi:D-ribose pyranose/furanose isomerase RbsD
MLCIGCGNNKSGSTPMESELKWQSSLKKNIPQLGHRNWILIVDKAFPAQNAPGMVTITTDAEHLDVLAYTLRQIDSSSHVKPIVFCDAELRYLTGEQVAGIDAFRDSLTRTLGGITPQVILHESVFAKIDEASKLFKVLVLKTNGTIPYSSVFIQLDCKYWTAEKESALRASMKAGH